LEYKGPVFLKFLFEIVIVFEGGIFGEGNNLVTVRLYRREGGGDIRLGGDGGERAARGTGGGGIGTGDRFVAPLAIGPVITVWPMVEMGIGCLNRWGVWVVGKVRGKPKKQRKKRGGKKKKHKGGSGVNKGAFFFES